MIDLILISKFKYNKYHNKKQIKMAKFRYLMEKMSNQ
jgi:hypothetical protein